MTKQSLMEEALSEQMKERAEMERKLQKLSKTMDHLERAKREEERPLIEEAHQKRLQDDEKFYKEQQEVTFPVPVNRQFTFFVPELLDGWADMICVECVCSKQSSRVRNSMKQIWWRRTGLSECSMTRCSLCTLFVP